LDPKIAVNIGPRNGRKYWIKKWQQISDPEMVGNIGLRNGG
jgi:hypothetical protein